MTAADRQRVKEAMREPEIRQWLKEQIDAKQRGRREILIAAEEVIVCARCGCDSDLRTIGCNACHDRHRKRARRAAGLYREQRTAEGWARRRQKESERKKRLRAALKAAEA